MSSKVTDLEVGRIRQQLLNEQARLLASLAPDEGENGRSRNPDRGDLAQRYSNRERDIALQAIEVEQLEQVKAALARIDDGTYGRCEHCGQPIPPGRLEILPYATLCVTCQSEQEKMYGAI